MLTPTDYFHDAFHDAMPLMRATLSPFAFAFSPFFDFAAALRYCHAFLLRYAADMPLLPFFSCLRMLLMLRHATPDAYG